MLFQGLHNLTDGPVYLTNDISIQASSTPMLSFAGNEKGYVRHWVR